jgi:hypothetical protein
MIVAHRVLLGALFAVALATSAASQPTPIPGPSGGGGGEPTGAAGGDLTGTYPNPALATVNADPGTYGDAATCIDGLVVNAKGLITAINETACDAGAGDITAVTAGAGLTGGGTTGALTISATAVINAQTGTSYTVLSTDASKLVTLSNGSAVAVTLPQATGSFAAGFSFGVQNKGAGTVTITPTTSTINGAATLTIATDRGCWITSDGTNWQVDSCTALVSGGGAPGGSDTQIQFNSASSFGGISTFTNSSGALTNSKAGAASTSAMTYSGAPSTGGTTTTDFPLLSLWTAAASGPTDWNTAGTYLGINTSSGFTGNAIDIHVNGGASVFSVNPSTTLTTVGGIEFESGSSGVDDGFQLQAASVVCAYINSSCKFQIASTFTQANQSLLDTNSAGWQLSTGAPSATAPNILPRRSGSTTGLGSSANGTLNLIAGGVKMMAISTTITLPELGTDATLTTRTVCQDTTSEIIYFGSGTLGICLGTSSARYKHDIAPLSMGLREVMALKPVKYRLNKDKGDPNKDLYGFIAEDMAKVTPKLVGYDKQGRPDSADYVGIIPILVNAVQSVSKLVALLFFWNALLTGGFLYLTFRKRA